MTLRRTVVAGGALGCLGLGALLCQAQEVPGAAYGDAARGAEWMRSWIDEASTPPPGGGKPPKGVLYLGRFADPVYYLVSVIGWDPGPSLDRSYPSVRVPVGFVTDLASIPRMFWSLLRPDGQYAYAAIIHDYLYWEQPVSREMADDIFRFAMQDFGISPVVIDTIFAAVRVGGGQAWSDNAARRAAGERRHLERMPTDPTTRWADWRLQPDVFAQGK